MREKERKGATMSGAFVKGDHVLPLEVYFSADLASMTSFLTAGVIDSIQTHTLSHE